MLKLSSLVKSFFVLIITILAISACQENESINSPNSSSEDLDALKKLVNEDELLNSFESNYEDNSMLNSLAKTTEEIVPIKVQRVITSVEKNTELEISEDELTATGVVTKTIIGKLLITTLNADSLEYVIEKDFTSIVTRNVEFEKYNNSVRPDKNWRMTRISLAEGNTGTDNVKILKMTLFMPDDSIIEIDSPNDYYLERVIGKRNQVPNLKQQSDITVNVEVKSIYESDDLVHLRYGSTNKGLKKSRQQFELISSSQEGDFFIKLYEATYTTNQTRGKKHAVVSVVSNSTIYDSESPVESNCWGIPYIVN